IEMEHGAVLWNSCYPTCTSTTAVIQLTQQVASTFLSSPAYARYGGQPVLMEFGMETLSQAVDWNAVQAAFPSAIWIHRSASGFTKTQSGGAFAWLDSRSGSTIPPEYDSSGYLTNYYATAFTYPTKLTWGSNFKGFNDTLASWSPPGGRYVYPLCGQTWLKTFS